ncbi:hypothetical protein VPH35_111249 [Triticum aestivum]
MPTPTTQLSEDGRYLPHPLEKYHRTPITLKFRVPSNTFRKECDNDAAAARTGPRVSPGTRLVDRKGYHRRPQEGSATPKGATTPVADEPPGISPAPKPTPTQTIESAPPNMPPTSLCHHGYRTNSTVSLMPPTRGLKGGRGDTGLGGTATQPTGGIAPTAPRSRPDVRQGLTRPPQARPNPNGSGPLPTRCSTPAAGAITTCSHNRLTTITRELRHQAPNRRLAQAQMGPKGPRSGPSGRRRPATRHAAPQPTATPSHQGCSRTADLAAESHRYPPSSTAAGRREPRPHLLASGEGTSATVGAIRATPVASAGGGEGRDE